MPYRQKKGKEKEKKSEKENEKKAERSTVKMYYWNVALSEHCEDLPLEHRGMWLNTTGTPRNVPLEHHGSVHWNTEEVSEVAPFTKCYCWDEEAAQFRQERDLQKVASQQIVRQPLVVAYQHADNKHVEDVALRRCTTAEYPEHRYTMLQCCTAWLKVERMM